MTLDRLASPIQSPGDKQKFRLSKVRGLDQFRAKVRGDIGWRNQEWTWVERDGARGNGGESWAEQGQGGVGVALDNRHSAVTGWSGNAEVTGVMGTEIMGRISCLSKVCTEYESMIFLGKCLGVNCVHILPLFSLDYIIIILTMVATMLVIIYRAFTICQPCTWSHLIISVPHQVGILIPLLYMKQPKHRGVK